MLSIVHNKPTPQPAGHSYGAKQSPSATLQLVASRHPEIVRPGPPDLERALVNPAAVFLSPAAVLRDPSLTRANKREILKRWALDEQLIELAQYEGMGEGPASRLHEVKLALLQIGDDRPPYPAAPAAFATSALQSDGLSWAA
jgi:hypothetical protein